DGTLDSSPFASADGTIRQVISLPDGKTVIGGHFSLVNGVPRRCLARLLSNGSVDPAFTPDLELFVGQYPPFVYKFAMQADGSVLAMLKTYVNPRGDYLVRVKPNGALDRSFEPVRFAIPSGDNEVVWALTLQADEKIVVGGEFQTV